MFEAQRNEACVIWNVEKHIMHLGKDLWFR
jgi:hypothetical protein